MELAVKSVSAMPPLLVSSLDLARIEALLDQQQRFVDAQALRAELARAEIGDPAQMPADVVTMNSTVRVVDIDAGEGHELTLVYPRDADGDPRKVSVFAPVGSAILGLRVGQTIQWPMPGGRERTLRIEGISYQPEASGHLHR